MQHTGFSHIDNADRNRRVVLNVIRENGPLSRRKISETCGLSITTANTIPIRYMEKIKHPMIFTCQ